MLLKEYTEASEEVRAGIRTLHVSGILDADEALGSLLLNLGLLQAELAATAAQTAPFN